MNCPWCGKEMQSGKIMVSCQFQPHWRREDEKGSKVDRFFGFDKKEIQGIDQSFVGWTKIAAFYCPDCKKFIFDGWVE